MTVVVTLSGCNSIWAQTTSATGNPDWTNYADWTETAPGYNTNQSALLAHNSDISGNPLIINNGNPLTISEGTILTTDVAITVEEGNLNNKRTINGTGIGQAWY